MKPAEKIERLLNYMNVTPDPEKDEQTLKAVLAAQVETKQHTPANMKPEIWRMIMQSKMTKPIVAAVIIVAVVLGLLEFIGGDDGSGVVWADVAQKVEMSRGVIYHERFANNNPKAISDHTVIHLSATQYRSEGYQSGKLWITMYENRETRQRVVLLHGQKGYVKEKMTPTDKEQQILADMMDPRKWVENFLSCEYSELGRKTIEGVLCEGAETTDPGFTGVDVPDDFPIESLAAAARLWVSVETRYPVLLETEFEGGSASIDQFQWDVELDASLFEPNIPPDYEQM